MKELFTFCGKKVLIDDVDYEEWKHLSLNWCHNAVRVRALNKALAACILKIGSHENLVPDHIDRDPLNCQRYNLRRATRRQNTQNQKLRSSNESGYKGVSWHKTRKKWQAYIMADYKRQHLGLFLSAKEAAIAYNEAALRLHGEFAAINVL